jgi:hypothetical protein
MRILRRRPIGTDANELAVSAPMHSGAGATVLISAAALVFSAYNLWDTSLKRADVSVFVPDEITYERDATAPQNLRPVSGFEVFAVPITIANGGARDAVVAALKLDAKNIQSGLTARFRAAYIAEPSYFNLDTAAATRQKTPFSALVIAGRSAWRGTIVFFPVSYSDPRAFASATAYANFYKQVEQKYAKEIKEVDEKWRDLDELRKKSPDLPEFAEPDAHLARVFEKGNTTEVTLTLVQPPPSGWLDRVFDVPVPSITLTLEAPSSKLHQGERLQVRTMRPGT